MQSSTTSAAFSPKHLVRIHTLIFTLSTRDLLIDPYSIVIERERKRKRKREREREIEREREKEKEKERERKR